MKVRSRAARVLEIVAPAQVPIPESQKKVLKGIAAFADRQVNDPSYANLARYCGLEERTVQRAVFGLESRGFLSVKVRKSQAGYQLSNGYQILPAGIQALESLLRLGALVDTAAAALVAVHQLAVPNGVTSCPPPNEFVVVDVKQQLQMTSRLSQENQATAMAMLARLPIEVAQQLADELRERLVVGQVRSPLGYLAKLIQAYSEGRYLPILAGRGAAARAKTHNGRSSEL